MKETIELLTAGIAALFVAVLVAFVIAYPLMLLWNAVIPSILGLTTITYWKALGLYIISGILFRGHSDKIKEE